jgi:hypothetical protein
MTFKGDNTSIRSVAFSPCGSWLASASGDIPPVRFWDIAIGDCITTLNVGTVIDSLAFDATGSRLHTDIGTFVLNLPPFAQVPNAAPATGSLPQIVHRQSLGLCKDKTWITWDSHKILWLPPMYRPGRSAVAASTVAIGCPSGRIVLMTFSAVNRLRIL